MQTIPIIAGTSSQTFRIVLNGVSYNMSVNWNTRASIWTLNIADENNIDIITGLALKAGLDLLEPFNFGIGKLYLYDTTEASLEATLTNIGNEVFLIYLTPEEELGTVI